MSDRNANTRPLWGSVVFFAACMTIVGAICFHIGLDVGLDMAR